MFDLTKFFEGSNEHSVSAEPLELVYGLISTTNPLTVVVPPSTTAVVAVALNGGKFLPGTKVAILQQNADRIILGRTSQSGIGWLLTNSAAQTIANGTESSLTWDTETMDLGGFHSGSSATVTIPAGLGGLYLIGYENRWASSGTGVRIGWIRINSGSDRYGYNEVGAEVAMSGFTSKFLADGDTIDIRVYQNSGGNLAATDIAAAYNHFYGTLINA